MSIRTWFQRRRLPLVTVSMHLNQEKLAHYFGVDKKAIAQGVKNQPPPQATGPDVAEQEIVQAIRAEHSGTTDWYAQENMREKHLRTALTAQWTSERLQTLYDETVRQFQALDANCRGLLTQTCGQVRQIGSHFKGFCLNHRIDREAVYPESQAWHIGILLLMVLVEGVANMTMFARVSNNGILGGLLEALVISGVNVTLSCFVGIVLRGVNAIGVGQRVLAGMVGVLYVGVLCSYHLAVGHYRTSLLLNQDDAAAVAIARLLDTPLGLNDLHSWMLVLIGLIFAVAALIDGYTLDDAIPGYGAITRRKKDAEATYLHLKEQYLAQEQLIADTQLAAVDTLLASARTALTTYRTSLSDTKQLLRNYQAVSNAWADACMALQWRYREKNREVRTLTAPPYFHAPPARPFRPDETLTDDLALLEAELVAFNVTQESQALQALAEEVKQRIYLLHAQQLQATPAYFATIEATDIPPIIPDRHDVGASDTH